MEKGRSDFRADITSLVMDSMSLRFKRALEVKLFGTGHATQSVTYRFGK